MNKIAELEVGQKIELNASEYELANDDKKERHPIYEVVEVLEVNPITETAKVEFADGQWSVVDNDSEFNTLPTTRKLERPSHYGKGKNDLIDYWCERYTPEELRGAFKSQISKYVDRLGHKDDEVKELTKIIDYATRYKKYLEAN